MPIQDMVSRGDGLLQRYAEMGVEGWRLEGWCAAGAVAGACCAGAGGGGGQLTDDHAENHRYQYQRREKPVKP